MQKIDPVMHLSENSSCSQPNRPTVELYFSNSVIDLKVLGGKKLLGVYTCSSLGILPNLFRLREHKELLGR